MSEPPDDQALLAQYLSDSEEQCPLCRYALRGLTGQCCPECGARLRLRVGLTHPNLAGWVTGLIGIAVALGFNGFMTAMFVFFSITDGPPPDLLRWFAIPIGTTVVSAVVLFAWLRFASRLRRLKRGALIGWSVLCWLLPISTFIGFLFLISY